MWGKQKTSAKSGWRKHGKETFQEKRLHWKFMRGVSEKADDRLW